jgi:anti-anti-sigma factor
MNTEINKTHGAMVMTACTVRELVRGYDQELVQRMAPVVRQKSIALDLRAVDRIDAAGIAALISLYGHARNAGHGFAVANPNTRVQEILEIVGLDRLLLPQHEAECLKEECLSAA